MTKLGGQAFSRFYEAHCENVLAYLARRCFDADVAMDLLAETFARAYEGRERLTHAGDDEVIGWVFGIAKHQLADFFREGRARQSAVARLGILVPSVGDDDLARIEELAGLSPLRQSVAAHFDELSSDHQQALQLRVVEERPYPEVAEQLKVSEQTARARVSRGLRKLEQSLDENVSLNREAVAGE